MKKKNSLLMAGPFANDPEGYRKFLVEAVATSTAIEIGAIPRRLMAALKKHSRRPQRITLHLSPSKGL